MLQPYFKAISLLLDEPHTTKVIATTTESGRPYAVPSPFLHLDNEGFFAHPELLETSNTNRNLLRSLWFDKSASITLSGKDGSCFLIHGTVFKAIISGPVFSRNYENVRKKLGDADLSTLWLIRPEEVINESYGERKVEEERRYPFSIHLDRLSILNPLTKA